MTDRDILYQTFGQRLREACQLRNLSQTVLGKRIGRSQGLLSLLETGRAGCGIHNLYRLAQALEVSADFLLGLTDDPVPYRRTAAEALAAKIMMLPPEDRMVVSQLVRRLSRQ